MQKNYLDGNAAIFYNAPMKLKHWLKKTDTTKAEFARLVEVSRPTVTLLTAGNRKPGRDLIAKIVKATDGLVSFEDWV